MPCLPAPLLFALLASPNETCAPSSNVAIDIVAELADERDDAAMRRFVASRLPARAAAQAVCVREDAARQVVVTIAWSNAARGNYALHFSATDPQRSEPIEVAAETCEACSTPEIVERIAMRLPEVIATLDAEPPIEPAAIEPVAAAPIAATPPARPIAAAVPPPRPLLTALGKAGIGIGVVGIATLATGAALTAKDPNAYEPDPRYRIVYRPVGISILVTGIAATIGGAAMLAEDLRGARKVAIAASMARGHVGVAIRGRF